MPSAEAMAGTRENVVVCVRLRPSKQDEHLWMVDAENHRIVPTPQHPALSKRAGSSHPNGLHDEEDRSSAMYDFRFDHLVLENEKTESLYEESVLPVVRSAMEGYNGTVFAYGQTGSGKTYTMSGTPDEPGVIPCAVHDIFEMIRETPERAFLLRVSFLEIYNETLKDLLAMDSSTSSNMRSSTSAARIPTAQAPRIIEERGRVSLVGLHEEVVTTPGEVLDLLRRGEAARHVGATDWNTRSSRSHSVFQITIESQEDAQSGVRVSQLNLIDLAGSERAASELARRKEGAYINKSLLTLGTVIAKLTEPSSTPSFTSSTSSTSSATNSSQQHIPYRDSKLTRLLQTSLSGDARVAVLCTISQEFSAAQETLSTLKFGRRCKMVVTKAQKHVTVDDKALLEQYRKELDVLRARLEASPSSADDESLPHTPPRLRTDLEALRSEHAEAAQQVANLQETRQGLQSQIDHLTRLILTSRNVAAATPRRSSLRVNEEYASSPRRGPRMSDLPSRTTHHPGSASPGQATDKLEFTQHAEIATMRRELRKLREEHQSAIHAIQEQLTAERLRAEEALAEAEEAKVEAQEARIDAEQARAEAEEANAENQELKTLLEESRLDADQAQSQTDDLQEDIQSLHNTLDNLTEELEQKRNEVNDWSEQAEDNQKEVQELLSQLEIAHEEAEEAQAYAEQVAVENQQLNQQIDQLKADLHDSESEMEQLRSDFEQISNQSLSSDHTKRQILTLEQALDNARNDANNARNDAEAARQELENARSNAKASRTEAERLKRQLQDAREEHATDEAHREFRELVGGSHHVDDPEKDQAHLYARIAALERALAEERATRDLESLPGRPPASPMRARRNITPPRVPLRTRSTGASPEPRVNEVEKLRAQIAEQTTLIASLNQSVESWQSRVQMQAQKIAQLAAMVEGEDKTPLKQVFTASSLPKSRSRVQRQASDHEQDRIQMPRRTSFHTPPIHAEDANRRNTSSSDDSSSSPSQTLAITPKPNKISKQTSGVQSMDAAAKDNRNSFTNKDTTLSDAAQVPKKRVQAIWHSAASTSSDKDSRRLEPIKASTQDTKRLTIPTTFLNLDDNVPFYTKRTEAPSKLSMPPNTMRAVSDPTRTSSPEIFSSAKSSASPISSRRPLPQPRTINNENGSKSHLTSSQSSSHANHPLPTTPRGRNLPLPPAQGDIVPSGSVAALKASYSSQPDSQIRPKPRISSMSRRRSSLTPLPESTSLTLGSRASVFGLNTEEKPRWPTTNKHGQLERNREASILRELNDLRAMPRVESNRSMYTTSQSMLPSEPTQARLAAAAYKTDASQYYI
ncbi:hypothetical protein MPSI1_002197 [Malassezia psittaci]|uniref:Kinesin motor domain-containing protein n=1 Tax=Malassezia psittaci TaxID=1821823 RepID=A0AAF0F9U3_9BASI|nr:hypothetical protein MPSI1_002197 [Malassezia psittaci]